MLGNGSSFLRRLIVESSTGTQWYAIGYKARWMPHGSCHQREAAVYSRCSFATIESEAQRFHLVDGIGSMENYPCHLHRVCCGGVRRDFTEFGEKAVAPESLHPVPGSHLTLVCFAFARGVPLSVTLVTFSLTLSGRP